MKMGKPGKITIKSGQIDGLISRTDTEILRAKRPGVKYADVVVRSAEGSEEIEETNRRLQGLLPRGVGSTK